MSSARRGELVALVAVVLLVASAAWAIRYRARYTIVPNATYYKLSARLLPTPWAAVTPIETGMPPTVNGALETEFDIPPTPGVWEVQVEACDASQCVASNPMTVAIATFTATATGTATRTGTRTGTPVRTPTATATHTLTPLETPHLSDVWKL